MIDSTTITNLTVIKLSYDTQELVTEKCIKESNLQFQFEVFHHWND